MRTPMPSIALPTGPYDWHAEAIPRPVFEGRVDAVRAAMARHGVTHAVVHGNGFDHGALNWLTNFTPKLGPAYALVLAAGPLRLLFAGGPGMKPSAQRLTWVEDVAALRTIGADAKRWLGETSGGAAVVVGLVEGRSMLRGDWTAVRMAAGGAAIELDEDIDTLRRTPADHERAGLDKAVRVLAVARERLVALAQPGVDIRAALIEMERAAYAAGAQDIRVKIGRRSGGPPTTAPDVAMALDGARHVVIAVRCAGQWAEDRFVVG